MKSNVYKIEKENKNLEAILKESERVAEYNGLTHKQTLQLRLICEEIDGMLPTIVDDYEGDFWIEFDKGVCKVNLSISMAEFSVSKKEELIKVATNKKNASAVGIVGKIRSAIENFFLSEENFGAYDMAAEYYNFKAEYNTYHIWRLEQYKESINRDKELEAWDELEKSIIASVADDVIVGVKGKQANIVIVKKFA